MRCVLVSATLDLRSYFEAAIAHCAPEIELVDSTDALATDVTLALAWQPAANAFAPYPNLRAVCSIAAGVDSLTACPSLPPEVDIVRVIDPDQAELMAGFVAWHVIGHQRGLPVMIKHQRDRVWQRHDQRPASDVPIGILGNGKIGQRVAVGLAALGFPVMAWSRTATPTANGVRAFQGPSELIDMLAETEVLVNLLPLTPQTRGLLNADLLGPMRRGGYLIQVGRGEHLVENDLLAALASGQLSGAALDVFTTEPLPDNHPFWKHPAIVVTPHAASDVSANAVARTLAATAAALRVGETPPDAIERERGY